MLAHQKVFITQAPGLFASSFLFWMLYVQLAVSLITLRCFHCTKFLNIYFFPDKPVPFTCEHCKKDFSGIWKHYKCLECKNIQVCRQCYDAKKHPPHKVEPLGSVYKGTLIKMITHLNAIFCPLIKQNVHCVVLSQQYPRK